MEMYGSEKVYHVPGYDDRWLCVDCKDELIEQIVTVCFVDDILGGGATMPFDNGIARYITAETIIKIKFPVDHKGRAYTVCKYCDMYSIYANQCRITQEHIVNPDKYVGCECPLSEVDETETESEVDVSGELDIV
jgi:hypothetical protein